MRVSLVSMLLAGGLLCLGATAASAQASGEVQGTANAHIRQSAALDRVLNRTAPRPRATSARRSCEDTATPVAAAPESPRPQAGNQCRQRGVSQRRERQRSYLNRAIDQSLNSGR